MALQGTIDSFPLTDVLQLLSASEKSGRLMLEGDRGRCELWIEDGRVVGGGAGAAASSSAAILVFEMLRFGDASFEFDSIDDGGPDIAVESIPLDESVEQAAALLEEWERIEAVVPSTDHRVVTVSELGPESITLDRPAWAVIAAIGDIPSVQTLAARLDLDEFSCCAVVLELHERGLVEIAEPLIGDVELLGQDDPVDDDGGLPDDDPAEPGRAQADFPERFPIDDLLGEDADEADDPWSSPEMEQLEAQRFAAAQTFDGLDAAPRVEPIPLGVDGPRSHSRDLATSDVWDEMVAAQSDESDETADEVLRQMSKLSPKAAEAIAAALNTVPAAPLELHTGGGSEAIDPVDGDPHDQRDDGDSRNDGDGPVSFMGTF